MMEGVAFVCLQGTTGGKAFPYIKYIKKIHMDFNRFEMFGSKSDTRKLFISLNWKFSGVNQSFIVAVWEEKHIETHQNCLSIFLPLQKTSHPLPNGLFSLLISHDAFWKMRNFQAHSTTVLFSSIVLIHVNGNLVKLHQLGNDRIYNCAHLTMTQEDTELPQIQNIISIV